MRKLIIKSILAGMSVAFGAIAYCLTKDQGILGAALFSIGILLVLEFDFKLFTSYVPKYAPLLVSENKIKMNLTFIKNSFLVFFFNFVGAAAVAGIVHCTRIADINVGSYGTFSDVVDVISRSKLDDPSLLSVFIMSVFCAIIIACICKAERWKHNVLYIVVLIATFIVCGFDHVVANSFYFVFSGELFTLHGLAFFAVNLLGNFVGGYLFVFIPLLGVDEAPHYYEDLLEKKKAKELAEQSEKNKDTEDEKNKVLV